MLMVFVMLFVIFVLFLTRDLSAVLIIHLEVSQSAPYLIYTVARNGGMRKRDPEAVMAP